MINIEVTDIEEIGLGISGAVISEDEKYRFALWRIWDRNKDCLLFIGVNGSLAGKINDDHTVVKMINFGKAWGYGGLFIGNLSPVRAVHTTYLNLRMAENQESIKLNEESIKRMRLLCSDCMLGWGETGKFFTDRMERILNIVGKPVYCIKVNRSGEPAHPLYMPNSSKLQVFTPVYRPLREVSDGS